MAALIGAIWSAKEFVVSRQRAKELSRAQKTDHWRKLAIHQVLMTSEQFLSTSQVTEQLRASSFDQNIEIKKNELSLPSVRSVLMEMVADGTIGQVFPDHYGIVQIPRDITVGAVADNIRGNRAARDAFAEILKHPGRFTTQELFEEIGGNFDLSSSDFALAILVLEQNHAAKRDQAGKWSPTSSKEN
ncbi:MULTISPECIES: hypothetical protein [unclassified Ruegeria]|uniref:hypothetical protein n=1 Tax=unclassified Ruegeria TaxID=2625375 RepID=UPI0014887683|nr:MULTISPECIES: hypothetical protein [unclassified Ruegeria]